MEVVQIKNEMNTVPLKNFSAVELDIFFTLCAKLKNEDTRKIRFDLNELKKMSNYTSTSTKRFSADLESIYDKIISVTYKVGTESHYKKFTLFTDYEVNLIDGYLEVSVNENFKHLLNNFEIGQFTIFELNELTTFKSNYTKNLYRLLKQYKSTGYFKIDIQRFRDVLYIPNSYRMSDIDKRILKPSLKEFEEVFYNLKINKQKSKGSVSHLEFTFLPQKHIKPQPLKLENPNTIDELEEKLKIGEYKQENPLFNILSK